MIVFDASAAVDLLLQMGAAATVAQRLAAEGESQVPHLIDLEIAQVLRRRSNARLTDPARCQRALDDLTLLPFYRHPHDHLLSRIWELRHNLTAYDAVYVALAEYLNAPLLTRDRRLADAAGHRARIDLV